MKFWIKVFGVLLFIGLVVASLDQFRRTRIIACKPPPACARTEVRVIRSAMLRFRDSHDRFPEHLELLCQPEPGNPYAPYLDADPGEIIDPWGSTYVLEIDGDHFSVISYGADGAPGGDDDAADIVAGYP